MILNNNKQNNKPELLSPAGNMETFFGVMNAGCDAVYLAGNKFGARAYADNFSDEELLACIRYAHLYNKKIYLTVNTLLKNEEKEDLISFIKPLYENGLDAVIVQDLGVLNILRASFPHLELHASTQLSVTDKDAAEFLKKMGVSRIVPARELSFAEIEEIKNSGVEVECFIHGAMCYCYSGMCLFSSVLGGRSGNRGRCAQPCRLPYKTDSLSEAYPLSLKDMSTLEMIGELCDAGIDSFKIEGRMKKPEYAAGVTAIYRKYIDEYYEKGKINILDEDRDRLRNLYIRSEVSNGYYKKRNGADMVTLSTPSYSGADEALLEDIRNKYLGKDPSCKLPLFEISFNAVFIEGENAYIGATYNDIYCEATGNTVQSAQNKPISEDDIIKSLSKLGNTVFKLAKKDPFLITISDSPYYSLKEINELRREVISKLEDQILLQNGYLSQRKSLSSEISGAFVCNADTENTKNAIKEKFNTGEVAVSVLDISQLEAVLNFDPSFISRIYITEKMLTCDKYLSQTLKGYSLPIYVSLPYVRRKDGRMLREYVKNSLTRKEIAGVLVRNLSDLEYFGDFKKNCDFDIITDSSLYSWNDNTISILSNYSDIISLPLELSSRAQEELAKSFPENCFEKLIYGRYPIMQSANCIFKTSMNCKKKNPEKYNWTYLTDRTGRRIPVLADCSHCHNTIYNSVPLSVYKFYDKGDNLFYRIGFTDENADLVCEVLNYYKDILLNKNNSKPGWEYTTGFEKKSTE